MKKILSFILVLISVQSIGQTTKLYAVRFNINGTTDSFFVHEFIGNGVYNSTGNYVMPKRDSMVAINGYSFPQSFGRFWLHADNIYRNSPPIAEAVDWEDINNRPSAVTNLSGTNTGDNATNTQYSGLAASKQDALVSGTNIKTINGSTVLGSGDLVVSGSDATKLAILNNLSDLNNAGTARTNLGLGNVDNTSDVNKPVSSATTTALNLKQDISTNNGGWTTVRVAGSNATTTGQSLVDITGLVTGTLTNSTKYEIEVLLDVGTSAVTTGCQYGVFGGGTGGAAVVSAIIVGTTTVNAATQVTLSAPGAAVGTFLTTSGTSGTIKISGWITTRGSGTATISIQHLKVTSGTSTVRVGSVFRYRLAQ